jgi:hypothetical protein
VDEGGFSYYFRRSVLIRLNANGSSDNTFTNGNGSLGGPLSALALQADGKVIIGGDFSSVSGTSRYRLARLHSSGAVDSSFASGVGGIGFDARPVQSIAMLADGRMLIAEPGGVDGLNAPKKIARLDSSGNVDHAFNPVIAGAPGSLTRKRLCYLCNPTGKSSSRADRSITNTTVVC